ncbi:MAG: hypothetical protein WCD68_10265, partial [Candidatus Acidiferrum sp.]
LRSGGWVGEELRGESWDGVGEHGKAPASEGGRYKGEPKSRVRSDCATVAAGGEIVARWKGLRP